MKLRYLLLTLIVNSVGQCFAQEYLKDTNYKKTCKSIYDAIAIYHVAPKPIDDDYSKIVFANTIKTINEKGILFTKEDLRKLSKFETSLDEELKGGSLQFINDLAAVYTRRLNVINEVLGKILLDKIDYVNNDSIFWGGEASIFSPENEVDLEKAWKRKVKMSVLLGLSTDLTIKDLKSPEFATKEAAIKKKVIAKLLKANANKLAEKYELVDKLYNTYFDCMISCQDAHSNFISKDVWMQFHDDLSKAESQFGFNIKESEAGEIQIASVAPGSPAWKVNVIHADDILRKIKLNNVSLDFSELDIDELSTQIRSPKITFVEMELQKADGTSVIVSLIKELIINESNAIKSYILKKDKNIGYIVLPGFYFDSEQNEFGLGCANDVAKEIMKLKAEGVEGLIFDLRYNGGGLIERSTRLTGPVYKRRFPFFDNGKGNRGKAYERPKQRLVV